MDNVFAKLEASANLKTTQNDSVNSAPGRSQCGKAAISNGLIYFSVALQALDALLTILNIRQGLFSYGPGPFGRVLGLGPAATWVLMKTSALSILILAVMHGRRWLLLMLDAWFVGLSAFMLFVLLR